MTATKARTASAVADPWSSARSTAACSSPLTLRRLAPHPEQHPGHHRCGEDQRHGFEELLVRLLEPADGHVQDEPEQGAQADGQAGAGEDPWEMGAVPGPGEVGQDDRHDERRLDAFAKAGQQAAAQGSDIHPVRTPRKSSCVVRTRSLVSRMLGGPRKPVKWARNAPRRVRRMPRRSVAGAHLEPTQDDERSTSPPPMTVARISRETVRLERVHADVARRSGRPRRRASPGGSTGSACLRGGPDSTPSHSSV